jgi:hypothetical protein
MLLRDIGPYGIFMTTCVYLTGNLLVINVSEYGGVETILWALFCSPLHKSYLSSRSNVYCFLRILTFLSLRNAEELSSAAKNASCAVPQCLENENQCASFACNSNRPRSGNTTKPVDCDSLDCDAVWHWSHITVDGQLTSPS